MKLALCALLPLAGSILLALDIIRNKKLRNVFAEAVTLLTSICVFSVLFLNGEDCKTLFSLSENFVCAFRVDSLSAVFIGLSAFLWPLAQLYAFEYMEHEAREGQFYTFYMLAYAVTILLAASANMFTLYIFFECLTIVTLPLVEHGQNKAAFRAGRTYLVYLIGGASLGFASMVITACATNGVFFTSGGAVFADVSVTVIRIAYVLMFLGFGAKAALFPLSGWLPKASVAPTPVTALLHAVAVVNAGIFSVCRGCYYVFSAPDITGSWAQKVTLILAGVTVAYGAIRAVSEHHLKRRLAWSTVSNLSYMLSALALLTPAGKTAALTHMLFHGLMKIVLFFAAGAILVKTGYTQVSQTRGLARRMPITFLCFTFAGLALTGVPPLCGFTSKYLIITAALKNAGFAEYFVCVCLIISAILTAIYIFTVVIPAYFGAQDGEICDAGINMKLAMVISCLAIFAVSLLSKQLILLISRV